MVCASRLSRTPRRASVDHRTDANLGQAATQTVFSAHSSGKHLCWPYEIPPYKKAMGAIAYYTRFPRFRAIVKNVKILCTRWRKNGQTQNPPGSRPPARKKKTKGERERGVRRPPPVAETGRSRRSPEGVEGRGHAQRASEAPEHRAAVREAKGRLGPGNLEGEARNMPGRTRAPPKASARAKQARAVRRCKATIANCGTEALSRFNRPRRRVRRGRGDFCNRYTYRAKIASLQFPRPKIRRILAETGRGGSGGGACSPVHQLVNRAREGKYRL